MFLRALAAIAVLFLVSCGSARLSAPDMSPYRMEIQQGNFVSQDMVSQLKLGMSKDQVRFVLGTPLITDGFHADRWDYVFRRQKAGSKELEHHKLAVFFEDSKLVRVDSDVTPAANTDAAGIKLPEARPEAPPAKAVAPQAKPVAPAAAKPEEQKKQDSAAAPSESRPAAQTAAEVPKPAPAVAPEKPAAAPVTSGDKQPQEKKSWWEQIKDAVKF